MNEVAVITTCTDMIVESFCYVLNIYFSCSLCIVSVNGFHSSISCADYPHAVVMSHLPSHDYEGLSRL